MMMYGRAGWLWMVGLIGSGLVLLAWNLDLFVAYEPWPQSLLAVVLGSVGVTFFVGYATASDQWWRLIPAWTMLALAVMLLLSALPAPPLRLIAALLFWGLTAAFAQIYWLQRLHHWWAIIPSGFMLVLGIVIALSGVIVDIELLGALLFVGMGGVFYLLYALSLHARQWWALIPASVLCLFGLLIAGAQYSAMAGIVRWWPILLLLSGLWTGWRTYRTPAPLRTSTQQPIAHRLTAKLPSSIWGFKWPGTTPKAADDRRSGEFPQAAPGGSGEILAATDDSR